MTDRRRVGHVDAIRRTGDIRQQHPGHPLGSPPDLVNLDYDATGQYAQTGALASLDTRIAQSDLIHATDFYTQAWQGFQFNNQQASIQSGIQIPIQTIANNTETVQYVNATLRLDVTPQEFQHAV